MNKTTYKCGGQVLVLIVFFIFLLTITDNFSGIRYQIYRLTHFQPERHCILADHLQSEEASPVKMGVAMKFKPMPTLNQSEIDKSKQCILNSESDKKFGLSKFEHFKDVHQTAHGYLTDQSVVIEIGGNVGEDAEAILTKFKPGQYIILEPLWDLYRKLIYRFRSHSGVTIYNFGLGKENAMKSASLKGSALEGTSVFGNSDSFGNTRLCVVNAMDFLSKIGVGFFEVDLITINCEGCELDLLEILTETTLISQFKYIQFQPHVDLKGLKDSVKRYCQIEQLLSRTHVIDYQYHYIWEMWRRKDVTATYSRTQCCNTRGICVENCIYNFIVL